MPETRITSFVLRFVEERGDDRPQAPWRGFVRHVQSREEVRFTNIEEVLYFMSRYVDLEDTGAGTGDGRTPDVERYTQVNGIRLHYLDYGGEGEPFLFLPGLTSNAHLVDGLVAAGLVDDFRVLSIDWRGRGLSEKPETGYSMGDHAGDVVALMDELGLEQALFCGHSFGGLIAFYLGARYPERVRGLVIIDSSPLLVSERTRQMVAPILERLGQRLPSMEAYLTALRSAPYMGGYWDQALERFYRSDVELYGDGTVQPLARPEAISETIRMEFEEPWDEYLAQIDQPVMLLNALEPFGPAGAPPILPREMAEETVALLGNCQYRIVPGNHMTAVFGENARQVVKAIRAFDLESSSGEAHG